MGLIVQKFGGSSVKDRDRIFNVARIVMNTRNAGHDVVVVVSAQGDTTDDLITKAAEITSDPSHREMDMLLAAGEEISISLLTMALQELGVSAISLTGWQAGFNTDRAYSKARIKRLDTERVESELARNRVVVVAGFQGLNRSDDITTLGRGGSDTSAVALAAALHADRCQIFTDVEGVYTADPRKIPKATKLKEITFDEMLELASLGAQVLNNRSVELAKKYNVELEVISSINPVPGTIVKEETKVEGMLIKGVAKDTDVAVLTVKDVPDVPGMSFKIFSLLAQKNINVDIILQTTGRDGKKDMSFTVPLGDAENAVSALKNATSRIGGGDITVDKTCAKVSIVGAGMQSHSGVASTMFEALFNQNINIKMISTSEIKISVIIDEADADKAVAAIHDAQCGAWGPLVLYKGLQQLFALRKLCGQRTSAQVGVALQALGGGEGAHIFQCGVVQNQRIKGVTVLKQADVLAEIGPEVTAAYGRHIQRLGHGQRFLALVDVPPAQLADLHGRCQGRCASRRAGTWRRGQYPQSRSRCWWGSGRS